MRFKKFAFLLLVLFQFTSAEAQLQFAGLQCPIVPGIFKIYLANHYQVKELNDSIAERTVNRFIKSLDPSKVVLFDSDVTELKQGLKKGFNQVLKGDCSAFEKTKALLLKRANENLEIVRKVLGPDYKLDDSVELQLDPEKRGFHKTLAERENFLKSYVHFQILNYMLSDRKIDESKTAIIHRYELVVKRLNEQTDKNTYEVLLDSFANALDPHSTYLSKTSLEDFETGMKLSLEGIGAVLSSQDGYTVIEEVIPGGGAFRSNRLRPKDKIIAVAQEKKETVNVIDMDLSDVVRLIRGKKGTKVTLTILRQGDTTERFEVTIVRDKINMKDQEAKLTFETKTIQGRKFKFGILDLPSFYGEGRGFGKRSSYEDVKKLLVQANKEKIDGLVLNLARNGGGLLDDAVRISGLFIREGGVVATQNTKREVEVLSDTDSSTIYAGPLVVLVSRISASASEILAGALKDYRRALIVGGDHTFGKGTVQVVSPFPGDLGAMKVTTGMFFLPEGRSTQHGGVKSDILMPSVYNRDDVGERSLDYSLGEQKIASFLEPKKANTTPGASDYWAPVTPELVKRLSEKSKVRVASEPKFQEILKEIAEAKQQEGIIKLAEIKSKSEKEKKKSKSDEKKNRSERVKDLDLPYVEESMHILADWITEQPKVASSKRN